MSAGGFGIPTLAVYRKDEIAGPGWRLPSFLIIVLSV